MPATTHPTEVAELAISLEQMIVWMRRAIRPTEWSAIALSTLDVLDRLGPHRVTDLTARERITQPGMTGLLSRLETAGLVRREPDPTDGRATLATITQAGSDYMTDLHRRRAELLAEHIAELPEADRHAILRAAPAIAALSARPLSTEGS